MESPILSLSRSPSTSSFAPGPHRRSRSHLNLQTASLSLAPLTSKYPISTDDYNPYYDPSTSDLHTSTSLSHISALPSPTGILTNSNTPHHSRANSRTRLKRKAKSNVSIVLPDNDAHPHGALTQQGFGGILKPTQPHSSRLNLQTDSSWLVQTGLALTESSRENKGQSWISKRDSSISLASLHTAHEEARTTRSGRTTPSRSRAGSRNRRSRRELAMTPAAAPLQHQLQQVKTEERDEIVPDWADAATRAEAQTQAEADVAASLSSDLAEELDDGDPYGVLDFDGHFDDWDDVDENEMRRELARNRFRLGGWFEGVVDVFLALEDDVPDGESDEGVRGLEEGRGEMKGEEKPARRVEEESVNEGDVEAPPELSQGVWGDVKWFGRLVARTVRS